MYILFDLIKSVWGVIRRALLFLDSVGVTFIDNIYNLMISAISAFDGSKIAEVAGYITKNCYIIIGIFALFRIALILINTIIDPEKFSDKNTNIGNMLGRIVIVVVLLVAVPFVFSKSRELQTTIINNNYISKLLIGTSITNSGEKADSDKGGAYIKDLVIRALIYPDENLAQLKTTEKKVDQSGGNTQVSTEEKEADQSGDDTQVSTEYECIVDDPACDNAVAAWNNDAGLLTLETYIGTYVEQGDEATYVYHYTPLIMLVVGGFVTWVLLSFTIDIAVRTVQLMVLEILSPLFIVTYIDPKASSNGPFKKWLTECGKTYVSLFIKIAIICLMIFFISKIDDLLGAATQNTSFFSMTRLLMLIAILIFAKKAPKWLGEMIGVETGAGLWSPKKLRENLAGYNAMKTAAAVGTAKAKNDWANYKHNRAAKKAAKREIAAKEKDEDRKLNRREKQAIRRAHGATLAQRKMRGIAGDIDAVRGGVKASQNANSIYGSIKGGSAAADAFRQDKLLEGPGFVANGIANIQGRMDNFMWGSGKERQDREKEMKKQKNFESFYTPEGRNGMTYKNSPVNSTGFNSEYMGLGNEDYFYAAEAIKRDFVKNGINPNSLSVSIDKNGIPTVSGVDANGKIISEKVGENPSRIADGRKIVTKEGADFVSDAFKGMQEKAIGDIIKANQSIASLMTARTDAANQVQQTGAALSKALSDAGIKVDITGKSAQKISESISDEISKGGIKLDNNQLQNIKRLTETYGNDQFNENNIISQMNQYGDSLQKAKSAVDALIKSNPEKYGNKTFDELLVIIQHEKEDTAKVLESYNKPSSDSDKK